MNFQPGPHEILLMELDGFAIVHFEFPGWIGPRYRVYDQLGAYCSSFMPPFNGGPLHWGEAAADKIPKPVRQFVETYAALLR